MEMESYSIKAEVILPTVRKYFERIPPARWSMLAAGTIDSATQVVLADMCTDIMQKLCADTIRVIIPEFKSRTQSADKKRMKLKVEGGLSAAFALALGVQEQSSKSSQKLDSLFKREISQRVNHILSAATGADSQLAPLIYIPGTFTKIEVLAKMVLLACGALKVYLGKMAAYSKYFRPCCRQRKRPEPSRDSKNAVCIFNREETTEAAVDILRKWTESEHESLSLRTNRELKKTAAEIVTSIVNDLHYPDSSQEEEEEEPGFSSTPHFNLGLVKDQLCEFFATCTSHASNGESGRKRNFWNFCQKTFETLTSELEKVRCRCMRMRWEEEICLPGSALPTPEPDAELGFRGIWPGAEDIFHKVALPAGDTNVDVDTSRHKADKFSRELAEKICRYVTADRTAVRSAWRRFSEPLLLEVYEANAEDLRVLRTMAEDSAAKFVQRLLLWLKMEPVTRGNHTDQVYGCLNDIDELVATTLIPPRIPAACLLDRNGPRPKTPPANEEPADEPGYSQRYAWASSHRPSSLEMDSGTPRPQHGQEFVVLDEIWS